MRMFFLADDMQTKGAWARQFVLYYQGWVREQNRNSSTEALLSALVCRLHLQELSLWENWLHTLTNGLRIVQNYGTCMAM